MPKQSNDEGEMADDGAGAELPEQVDAEEARELIAGGEVRVIDIRSAEDFAAERMSNSIRADPDDLDGALEDRETGREAVLVICADGSASAEMAERLRSDGREATSIDGGFGAWTAAHLPTAPGRDEEYEGPELKLPGAVAPDGDGDDEEEDEDDADRSD